ncbi:MAG: ACP S-malonyltransferase [Bacillota bacterium]|jgi:[acyl-carrier-protein] S-malonyltransferase
MAKIVLVFAGQGAQYSGMGKDLWENSQAARAVFAMADRIRPGTSRQCFEASKEELSQTINTQPALFTVDLACAAALAENDITAAGAAGFSLGELPALAFSGIMSYEDAFALTCKRAQYMQQAAEKNNGSMMAILRLANEQVEAICAEFDRVYAVNYNCPGQLVVAGDEAQLTEYADRVAQAGGKAMKLAVNGAFHSPFMQEAAENLVRELDEISFNPPHIPVYSNVTALPYKNGKDLLAKQVISPVLWQKTIENMLADGYDTFIEVGAGKTLGGLIKKISAGLRVFNVEDSKSLQKTLEALKGD